MAVVQIEVVLDNNGAIQGMRQLEQGLDRTGKSASSASRTASTGMESMSRSVRDTSEMVNVLASRFGVVLPAGITRAIAHSELLKNSLKGVGGVVGGVLAAFTFMDAINNLDKMMMKVRALGDTWQEYHERMRALFGGEPSGIVATKQAIENNAALKPLETAFIGAQNQAALAGKTGISAALEQQRQRLEEIHRTFNDVEAAARKISPLGSARYEEIMASARVRESQARVATELETNEKLKTLRAEHAKTIADIELKAQQAGQGEMAKQRLQLAHDLAEIDERAKHDPASADLFLRERTAVIKADMATITAFAEQYRDQMAQIRLQEKTAGLGGMALIEAETTARIGALQKEFKEKWGDVFVGDPKDPHNQERMDAWVNASANLAGRIGDIQAGAALKTQRFLMQMTDETMKLQEQAALAVAPTWDRATMQIAVDMQQQMRQVEIAMNSGQITATAAADRTAAVWQIAAGRTRDAWQSAFEELFSGGLSQMLERQAKQFAARLLAQFTLQSGAASFLGPLLGLPTGMPGGTTMSSGATMGGFGALGAGMLGLGGFGGAGGFIPGFGTAAWNPNAGTGFSSTGAYGGAALPGLSAPGLIGMLPGAINSQLAVSLAKSTGFKGLGGAMVGAAPMLAALLGGKVGGTSGMIGGSILGMLGAGYMTGNQQMTMMLAKALGISGSMAGALLAGVGGGLLGFGIGQQYGKVPGMIAGGLSGALIAALVSTGPIGWIVGGIMGLLGGLFGGIFGGNKKKKQAEQFATAQAAEIAKVIAAFKGFQMDYASAFGNLEQMKSDSQSQLSKLGGEGRKVYERTLLPQISAAEKQLDSLQHERERRMGLVFGPPQFAKGGWTGATGGIVHPYEYVLNQQATSRIGKDALDALNRGDSSASVGGDTYHITIQANDAKSFETWLRNDGGFRAIQRVASTLTREGRA